MKPNLAGLFGAKAPLERDAQGHPASQSLKLAVTLLLWDAVYADGERAPEETRHLIAILDHEFRQMDEQSGKLIQLADLLREHRRHIDQALAQINSSYSHEQREHLGRLLQSMAEADGKVDPVEEELLQYLREKLNLQST